MSEMAIFYNLFFPSNKVYCDICEKDITDLTRIQCAECQNMDICGICFALGFEKREHLSTHNYQVIGELKFALFKHDWTALNELCLFEGIEKYGFGNWEDIGCHLSFPPSKVKSHYRKVFLIGKQDHVILTIRNPGSYQIKQVERQPKIIEENIDNDIVLLETGFSARRKSKRTAFRPSQAPYNSPANIVGYLPLRKGFEFSCDNDAEQFIAQMEFSEEDTKEELDLKFKVLDIYNQRLNEREKRHQFVLDWGYLNLRNLTLGDKMYRKMEKNLIQTLKPVQRFQTKEEHLDLIDDILKMKKIRKQILELSYYQSIGITDLSMLEEIMAKKRKSDIGYKRRIHQDQQLMLQQEFMNQKRQTIGHKRRKTRVGNQCSTYDQVIWHLSIQSFQKAL